MKCQLCFLLLSPHFVGDSLTETETLSQTTVLLQPYCLISEHSISHLLVRESFQYLTLSCPLFQLFLPHEVETGYKWIKTVKHLHKKTMRLSIWSLAGRNMESQYFM